ncbi:hypothetical protein [Micromonospora sp. NPDC047134]|uniref:hypothetical protein n=1 Tax=Micromonospora sp. NPDC047134 TaxID=3154340 RepID=UPI00340561D3
MFLPILQRDVPLWLLTDPEAFLNKRTEAVVSYVRRDYIAPSVENRWPLGDTRIADDINLAVVTLKYAHFTIHFTTTYLTSIPRIAP